MSGDGRAGAACAADQHRSRRPWLCPVRIVPRRAVRLAAHPAAGPADPPLSSTPRPRPGRAWSPWSPPSASPCCSRSRPSGTPSPDAPGFCAEAMVSLQSACYGGAPMAPGPLQRVASALPCQLYQVYGLTEAGQRGLPAVHQPQTRRIAADRALHAPGGPPRRPARGDGSGHPPPTMSGEEAGWCSGHGDAPPGCAGGGSCPAVPAAPGAQPHLGARGVHSAWLRRRDLPPG